MARNVDESDVFLWALYVLYSLTLEREGVWLWNARSLGGGVELVNPRTYGDAYRAGVEAWPRGVLQTRGNTRLSLLGSLG